MPERAAGVTAYVGLGANLGDARGALDDALRRLGGLPGTRLMARSSVYRTAPVDSSGPDYLNAVAELSTRLSAHDLLAELQAIELAHGRERPYRNAPRTLDLDLLLYGDTTISTPQLSVPHPRLHERAFVLAPLAEVAPGLVLAGRGRVEDCLCLVAAQRIDRLDA
jgi:2-amino-4-hydroxy-6-hydroxymethyldihydropteridine diphosphokinase